VGTTVSVIPLWQVQPGLLSLEFPGSCLVNCQAWWCTPVTSALGRLRQENCEFKASLGYIVRPCLQKKKKQKKQTHNNPKQIVIPLPLLLGLRI
jgi:hypothetical protein